MTSQTLFAKPTKLRSGAWGATTIGVAKVGDTVQITTAAGKTWKARVTSIAWSGDGKSIVATESLEARVASPSRSAYRGYAARRTGGCKGCGGPIRDCAHHRAMEGYCGSCAFDEFDC